MTIRDGVPGTVYWSKRDVCESAHPVDRLQWVTHFTAQSNYSVLADDFLFFWSFFIDIKVDDGSSACV